MSVKTASLDTLCNQTDHVWQQYVILATVWFATTLWPVQCAQVFLRCSLISNNASKIACKKARIKIARHVKTTLHVWLAWQDIHLTKQQLFAIPSARSLFVSPAWPAAFAPFARGSIALLLVELNALMIVEYWIAKLAIAQGHVRFAMGFILYLLVHHPVIWSALLPPMLIPLAVLVGHACLLSQIVLVVSHRIPLSFVATVLIYTI